MSEYEPKPEQRGQTDVLAYLQASLALAAAVAALIYMVTGARPGDGWLVLAICLVVLALIAEAVTRR